MTNPPCTAIVSHAVSADERWSSATIGAFAAVAENHTVIPRNMASDNHASCANGETPFNTESAAPAEDSVIAVWRVPEFDAPEFDAADGRRTR